MQSPTPSPEVPEPSTAEAVGGDMVAAEAVPPLTPVPPPSAPKPAPDLAAPQSQQASTEAEEGPAPPALRPEPALRRPNPQLWNRPEPAPGDPPGATIPLPSSISKRSAERADSAATSGRFGADIAGPPGTNPFVDHADVPVSGQGGWVALPNSATPPATMVEATTRGEDSGTQRGHRGVRSRLR